MIFFFVKTLLCLITNEVFQSDLNTQLKKKLQVILVTLLLYWPFCSLSGFFYCQILSEYLSIPCIKSIAKVKSLQGFILSGNAPFSPVNFFSWVRAFLWMLRSKEENVEQHLWQIKILYCLRWWGTGAGDKDKDLQVGSPPAARLGGFCTTGPLAAPKGSAQPPVWTSSDFHLYFC